MATKYDLESLLNDVQAMIAANLNTKIAAIESDRGALSPTLKTVASGAYFLQTLNDAAANFDPYILYGVDDIESDGRGANTLERFKLSVVIVLADNGQDMNITKRMLRYRQALKEIFETNWQTLNNGVKLRVAPSIPVPITNLNSDERYQAVGLAIDAELA